MIHVDASTLEGGGQLPRLALCLSALTLTPIHLTNIRANRASPSYSKKTARAPKPGKDGGLKESHLAALNFLAEACDAKVTGDEVGSREVVFKPRKEWCLRDDKATIELKNPGSVFLIFQALFPYLVFARRPPSSRNHSDDESRSCELTLRGGTNVDKSMSLDYVQQVFLPICQKIGLPDVRVECVKRGWAGGASEIGELKIQVDMPNLKEGSTGFSLDTFRIEERGKIDKIVINVLAYSTNLRQSIYLKITEWLLKLLGEDVEVELGVDEDSAHDSRLYILLVAHTENGWRLGRDLLGSGRKAKNEKERDMMTEKAVAKVVGDFMLELQSEACVDEHMQDQLVVFQALAKGESIVKGRDGEGTLHTQTVRWVCEQMLGERGLSFSADGGCKGIGWHARDIDVNGTATEIEDLKIDADN